MNATGTTDDLDKLLTTNQVAELLSTTPRSVLRWARNGTLPAVQLGKRIRVRKRHALAMLTPAVSETLPSKREKVAQAIADDELLRRAKIRR